MYKEEDFYKSYDNSYITAKYIMEKISDKNGFYPLRQVSLANISSAICNEDICPYYKKEYSCFGISGCILKLIQDKS